MLNHQLATLLLGASVVLACAPTSSGDDDSVDANAAVVADARPAGNNDSAVHDASLTGVDAQPGVDASLNPDANLGPAPNAPAVDGEVNAGSRPSWIWTVPNMAAGFRYRIDGGSWLEVNVSVVSTTATAALTEGVHLFEVQARSTNYAWSTSGQFSTTVEYFTKPGFWTGVQRGLATTPYGRICAVSAHNCYVGTLSSPSANLAATLTRIRDAQTAGADLIELDIKDQAGEIRVDHEDAGNANGARLVDVLDATELQQGNQILFIEIKETTPTAAFIQKLITMLRDRRQYYAHNGRPVVLRAFSAIGDNLTLIQNELSKPENLFIRSYIRTSVLYSGNQTLNIGDYQGLISAASSSGHHMVEFHYRDLNLAAKLNWARAQGLGINVWTIPVAAGEVFIASLRDEVDVLTTDYAVANARAGVQEQNALFHVDATEQTGGGATSIPYMRTNATPYALAVNGSNQPSLSTAGAGGTLYGGHLVFNASNSQSGELYDADVQSGHGVLISVVAKFDTLNLGDGATMSVLAKTEGGAWGLELHNPAGAGGTVLRFAVRVGGSYVYASIAAGHLNTSESYIVTGAYDGNGAVRLWVNNSDANVVNGSASGGVVNNNVPVRIGADPVGTSGSGYHFQGRIQRVLGQSWTNH